jgi:hypothetical protein
VPAIETLLSAGPRWNDCRTHFAAAGFLNGDDLDYRGSL